MKKILNWFSNTFGDTWLANIIKKTFFSLDNSNSGLSGKKLTIITLMYCVVKMHEYWCQYAYAHNDFSLFPIILGSDFATILSLFGINEYGKKKTVPLVPDNQSDQTTDQTK